MSKKEREYPTPKKGEPVKCLGCNNGFIIGEDKQLHPCRTCKGKGTINA